MNKSTNYELNLVEGTDVVNPLVQDVPNWEKVDEVMFENACNSVGLATELLSGTVHALTRENPNTAMFRFVATSDYNAGDTFTVDGVQVTALMANGTALTSRAYVINSNVLCCLVGSIMTVFTGASGDITAANSLKLGGQLPEYYASAQSVVEAINLAQGANTISLSNQQALGGLKFAVANTEADATESGIVYLVLG